MIPEKVLERYVRVKALAERGYQGEKKVAQAMAQKLRAEYPGIDAASSHIDPNGGDDKYWWPGRTSQAQTGGNWEKLFSYAQDFWGAASSFAETITEAARGASLATQVRLTSRVIKSGNLLIGFSMPMEVYEKVSGLNQVQKAAFKHRLLEALSVEMDRLFDQPE